MVATDYIPAAHHLLSVNNAYLPSVSHQHIRKLSFIIPNNRNSTVIQSVNRVVQYLSHYLLSFTVYNLKIRHCYHTSNQQVRSGISDTIHGSVWEIGLIRHFKEFVVLGLEICFLDMRERETLLIQSDGILVTGRLSLYYVEDGLLLRQLLFEYN